MYWVSAVLFVFLCEPANYAVICASSPARPFSYGHLFLTWDQIILIFNSSSMTNQHIVADGSLRDAVCQMIAVNLSLLICVFSFISFKGQNKSLLCHG